MAEKSDMFPHDSTLETLPAEERIKKIEVKLRKLIKYAYTKAPGFKKRMDQAGVSVSEIKGIADLPKIPVLHKDELIGLQNEQPPFGGYLAVPLSQVERIYQSPGPIYDPQRKTKQGLFPQGIGHGQVAINTWAYQVTPAGLMVDSMLRDMGFTVFPSGTGNSDLQMKVMRDLQVAAFAGTPSFLAAIIRKAEDTGYNFKQDFNLKYAMVFGEMGGDALREMFSSKYDIHCLGGDIYITADLGPLANTCEKKCGLHINTDVIVEIADPVTGEALPPGEAGEIVVTPFDEVYPLIRFGTGDLSSLIVDTCACGRTTPRLSKLMGRCGDAVRVRAMFVHPNQTNEVMRKFAAISNYQLAVTRTNNRDNMALVIELAYEPTDKVLWIENLKDEFQSLCKVRFDSIEFAQPGTLKSDCKKIIDNRVY